jgi:hypothetical protein
MLRAISPFYAGPQDRTLQIVIGLWIVFVFLTMWSHACRTLSRFNRKDEYPFGHRIG